MIDTKCWWEEKPSFQYMEGSVPIIGHSSAKPEFGTGAVMVCSYGDYNDVQLFRELGLRRNHSNWTGRKNATPQQEIFSLG